MEVVNRRSDPRFNEKILEISQTISSLKENLHSLVDLIKKRESLINEKASHYKEIDDLTYTIGSYKHTSISLEFELSYYKSNLKHLKFFNIIKRSRYKRKIFDLSERISYCTINEKNAQKELIKLQNSSTPEIIDQQMQNVQQHISSTAHNVKLLAEQYNILAENFEQEFKDKMYRIDIEKIINDIPSLNHFVIEKHLPYIIFVEPEELIPTSTNIVTINGIEYEEEYF